ncbi:gasdermin-A isoform X2 [Myiozetetes cayanensis]|uniref:gasdermin-A isoform X2 n=1 Tax=Myiozetetes cayanensis TaxID=478635 RepID=UPI002160C374|nr:gasdermin-A isoform X2 [Myiozetetes cayanensis]
MFKKVTRYIVSQMDPKEELVPVESIADHEHFRPSCLLVGKEKRKTVFHQGPYYQRTGFTLDDVLLPGDDGKSTDSLHPSGDGPHSRQFTLTKVTTDQVDGCLSLSVDPANVELKGGGSVSQEFSIKPQTKTISMGSLEALRQKRKINMDHSFIQQLQRTKLKLFLVYETLEASEEAVYKESTKGTTENRQSIVIPKSCTLAFRAIEMNIYKGEWRLGFFIQCSGELVGYEDDGPSEVVREVVQHYAVFSKLSPDLRVMFLKTITAVLRDRNLFPELSQKMEDVFAGIDGYELKTESPDLKDLLSTLENSPRDHRRLLAEGITYTLDALDELLDDQLLLLLESLERKIVSQQLKLVEKLLEHELEKPFRVDARLLSFPRQEDQHLTMALVELSRVKLQEDGSAVPMEHPFEVMAALYVALYILCLLSDPK